MAPVMWRSGRRLFSAASVLIILTAAAHTAGHFSPSSGPSEDVLLAAMDAHRIPLGLGMTPTFLDIFKTLSLTMSLTFLALGATNLMIASSADVPSRLLARIIRINVAWVGAFLVLMLVHQVLPPLICAVAIELVLLAALV